MMDDERWVDAQGYTGEKRTRALEALSYYRSSGLDVCKIKEYVEILGAKRTKDLGSKMWLSNNRIWILGQKPLDKNDNV